MPFRLISRRTPYFSPAKIKKTIDISDKTELNSGAM